MKIRNIFKKIANSVSSKFKSGNINDNNQNIHKTDTDYEDLKYIQDLFGDKLSKQEQIELRNSLVNHVKKELQTRYANAPDDVKQLFNRKLSKKEQEELKNTVAEHVKRELEMREAVNQMRQMRNSLNINFEKQMLFSMAPFVGFPFLSYLGLPNLPMPLFMPMQSNENANYIPNSVDKTITPNEATVPKYHIKTESYEGFYYIK